MNSLIPLVIGRGYGSATSGQACPVRPHVSGVPPRFRVDWLCTWVRNQVLRHATERIERERRRGQGHESRPEPVYVSSAPRALASRSCVIAISAHVTQAWCLDVIVTATASSIPGSSYRRGPPNRTESPRSPRRPAERLSGRLTVSSPQNGSLAPLRAENTRAEGVTTSPDLCRDPQRLRIGD
jgi:hypothetical protein